MELFNHPHGRETSLKNLEKIRIQHEIVVPLLNNYASLEFLSYKYCVTIVFGCFNTEPRPSQSRALTYKHGSKETMSCFCESVSTKTKKHEKVINIEVPTTVVRERAVFAK